MLAYGEEKAIHDAREAGANGFIMVDLPPEEAINFREKCQKAEYVHQQSLRLLAYLPKWSPSSKHVLCPTYRPFNIHEPHQIPCIHRRLLYLRSLQSMLIDFFFTHQHC
jgi:hypothetical protein